jgi:hypothetical protein
VAAQMVTPQEVSKYIRCSIIFLLAEVPVLACFLGQYHITYQLVKRSNNTQVKKLISAYNQNRSGNTF